MWRIDLVKDCLDALRMIPDASVDAIVTDPPYGIGTKQPGAEDLIAWLGGDTLATGGDFMGKEWQIPTLAVWAECFRVLKPGGHLVSFAGSRTVDLIGLGIRCAGFDLRDSLAWIYGSGFPKSLNVGKAIDREAGAVRPVVGSRILTGNAAQTTQEKGGTYAARTDSRGVPPKAVDVTGPATPEAATWEGWGTALKPCQEPIILARKPLSGTVAGNVLEHGTGAINVDGCRVGTDWAEPDRPESWKASGHSDTPGDSSMLGTGGTGIHLHPAGRWPGNVLMGHAEGCQIVGTRQVERMVHGDVDPAATDQSIFGVGRKITGTAPESVPVWACVPGCPVATLDEQSGATVSRPPQPGERGTRPGGFGSVGTPSGDGVPCGPLYGDAGGASRFFTQIEPDPPFFYTGKASTRERNAGLGKRARHKVTDGRTTPIDNPYQRGESERLNTHVSVKPLALMRWLVRLITPPGGLVLDPYAGSGTTIAAAALEGFRAVGLERESEYVEIARARVKHWARRGTVAARLAPSTPLGLRPDLTEQPVDPRQETLFPEAE
jgi:DNA modification methylase